jgi:hypothetical protein
MGIYMMKTGLLGGMMGWSMKQFFKGKIAIFPTFKGGSDLKKLFRDSRRGAAR